MTDNNNNSDNGNSNGNNNVTTPPDPAGPPVTTPVTTGNAEVDACIVDVKNGYEKVKGLLGAPLSKLERMRLTRVPSGVQQLVPELVALTLTRPGLAQYGTDPAELERQLTLLTQLKTLLVEMEPLYTGVVDTVSSLTSDLNQAGLHIYSIAGRAGPIDPGVAAVVEKVKATLARGPRVKHQVTKIAVKTVTVPLDTPVEPLPTAAASTGQTATSGRPGSK